MQTINLCPTSVNPQSTNIIPVAEWDKDTKTLFVWRRNVGQPVSKHPEPCTNLREAKKRIADIYAGDKIL